MRDRRPQSLTNATCGGEGEMATGVYATQGHRSSLPSSQLRPRTSSRAGSIAVGGSASQGALPSRSRCSSAAARSSSVLPCAAHRGASGEPPSAGPNSVRRVESTAHMAGRGKPARCRPTRLAPRSAAVGPATSLHHTHACVYVCEVCVDTWARVCTHVKGGTLAVTALIPPTMASLQLTQGSGESGQMRDGRHGWAQTVLWRPAAARQRRRPEPRHRPRSRARPQLRGWTAPRRGPG